METVPIWCDGCNQQGEISIASFQDPTFIICNHCGEETAEVWCPKCQMGGHFIEDIKSRPNSWNCPECKSAYQLPLNFYDMPTKMFIAE